MNVFADMEGRIRAGLAELMDAGTLPAGLDVSRVTVDLPADPAHGDFATSAGLALAKAAGMKPRDIAQPLAQVLSRHGDIAKAEVAGPGFVNVTVTPDYWRALIAAIRAAPADYGRARVGGGARVNVEYVSANPTGPMHVGHCRGAVFGDALANLLAFAGYEVTREYYINDAGRQTAILAVSVWLRYLEAGGETLAFPQNGYRGDYLRPVAAALRARLGNALHHAAAKVLADLPADAPTGDKERHIDALIARCRELIGEAAWQELLDTSIEAML